MTMKQTATVKTTMKITLPADVWVLAESDEPIKHHISTQEDLEATLHIASTCGWKIKYKNKIIFE